VVYALDAMHVVHQLSADTLAPLAQSPPLIESEEATPGFLLASDSHVFVGSAAISETLVLDRIGLGLEERLEGYGPLALEPGERLFMIPLGLEKEYPWNDYQIWAYDLGDLGKPPEVIRNVGTNFDDLVIDPAARRLYLVVSNIVASPPHRGQTYDIYGLDVMTRTASLEWERGSLTRPAINPRTGEIAGSRVGLNWTRRLLIADGQGQELASYPSLDGQPAIDAAGEWIYLLRQRGLWLLREADLALQSVLPFTGPPPEDLALSPDGETLYLFGNGWLGALSTAELQDLGFEPVSPLPTEWFSDLQTPDYVQLSVYRSPQFEEDGVAFAQLLSGMRNVLETYRTTDGGHSWTLLSSLLDRSLVGAAYLSLSPDFNRDQAMTAQVGSTIVRSSDGGLTWDAWQPRIAFSSDRDGNREIYTMDQDGNDVWRHTVGPAKDENPAWSPAWTHLAFQTDRNGNWDIYTVRAGCDPTASDAYASCDLRQLTGDPADDMLPAWSPDGRSIAFVSTRDGNPEIYLMDTDGGNQRRLTWNPAGDWRPAWLPDSRHLVFVSDRAGDNDIYEMAIPSVDAYPLASEPETTPVIVSPADDRDPAAVPGFVNRLLFLSDREGFKRTFRSDATSQPWPFAETDRPEAHPATLPGQELYILVSAERDGSMDVHRIGPGEYTPLAPSPAYDGQPAGEATRWQPDMDASLAWLQELEEHLR
jgi:hypothetical protein